jgi:hypothetical protein
VQWLWTRPRKRRAGSEGMADDGLVAVVGGIVSPRDENAVPEVCRNADDQLRQTRSTIMQSGTNCRIRWPWRSSVGSSIRCATSAPSTFSRLHRRISMLTGNPRAHAPFRMLHRK